MTRLEEGYLIQRPGTSGAIIPVIPSSDYFFSEIIFLDARLGRWVLRQVEIPDTRAAADRTKRRKQKKRKTH